MAVAQPVAEEAGSRSAAALAALRGQVTAKEIRKLARKHERRAKAGQALKVLVVAGILAGGACVAWRWWDKQANPDWLVEPPAPTEVDDRAPLTSVDGSGSTVLDPDARDEQSDADTDGPDAVDGTDLDDRPDLGRRPSGTGATDGQRTNSERAPVGHEAFRRPSVVPVDVCPCTCARTAQKSHGEEGGLGPEPCPGRMPPGLPSGCWLIQPRPPMSSRWRARVTAT